MWNEAEIKWEWNGMGRPIQPMVDPSRPAEIDRNQSLPAAKIRRKTATARTRSYSNCTTLNGRLKMLDNNRPT